MRSITKACAPHRPASPGPWWLNHLHLAKLFCGMGNYREVAALFRHWPLVAQSVRTDSDHSRSVVADL